MKSMFIFSDWHFCKVNQQLLHIDLQHISRYDESFCAGTYDSDSKVYVCGDARLGPVMLPACLPLTPLIDSSTTYARFGGLCPGKFLSKWTNYAPPGKSAWFVYPFADEFANNTAGIPIHGRLALNQARRLIAFGGITGNFVASTVTSYDQRALPLANLDFDSGDSLQVTYNYNVYEVKKPVVMVSGLLAS
jgi:hypothetical protein